MLLTLILLGLVAGGSLTSAPAFAQRSKRHREDDKRDFLTLRYKPQVGTLLYNGRTDVEERVTIGSEDHSRNLSCRAQLAFHNVDVDYKKDLWSFDQYFTAFRIRGNTLQGDTLQLGEEEAAGRITRLTYRMTGEELAKQVIDSLHFRNTEAQSYYYYFQPLRLLVPLPQRLVTYGDTWTNRSVDTVHVRDTINIGVTTGTYVYDVRTTYQVAELRDTLGLHIAVIVAVDTGSYSAQQSNTVTRISLASHGPISGSDTTLLDLYSGRVMKRIRVLRIPAVVEVATLPPFADVQEVRSVYTLDDSNARKLGQE